MFVTLHHRHLKSVTGTNGPQGLVSDGSLLTAEVPPPPRRPVNVPFSDKRTGSNGGLLYNCSPRDVVGSVMFGLPSPYREVERADADQFGPVLGILVDKPASTICEVVHAGLAPVYANLEAGRRYYLGHRGTLRAGPLDADPQIGYVHYVGLALNSSTLLVQPSYPLIKRAL